MDRIFQVLLSKWRVGLPPSIGPYPRHLQWVTEDRRCRFCGYCSETVPHTLFDCPGLALWRTSGLSPGALVGTEHPDQIIRLAQIDQWLRDVLPFIHPPPDDGFRLKLEDTLKARKRHLDPETESSNEQPPNKRQRGSYLVAYHRNLPRMNILCSVK